MTPWSSIHPALIQAFGARLRSTGIPNPNNPWGGGHPGHSDQIPPGFQLPQPTLPVEPDWGDILKAGNSAQYFGHADYNEALSRGVSRDKIIRYLDANPGVLREQNVKGGGGLYDQIQREGASAIGTHYGDYTKEGRKHYFGAADYAGSRAAGATDLQIQNWLAQNPNTLRGGNTFESLKAGYAGGGYGDGTTGTGGYWSGGFNPDQMSEWNANWKRSMDEYNQKMSEWQSKWEAKQNEVTHKGSRAVEGSGSVSSIAPAEGTYSGGRGGGTANWMRRRTGSLDRARSSNKFGLNIS